MREAAQGWPKVSLALAAGAAADETVGFAIGFAVDFCPLGVIHTLTCSPSQHSVVPDYSCITRHP
jgi:hypothetical protein